ncbi:MAG: hypothetical protein ACI9SC_002245 [Gammaproteobacteria bacterium]|jgi:hypothetical protein
MDLRCLLVQRAIIYSLKRRNADILFSISLLGINLLVIHSSKAYRSMYQMTGVTQCAKYR